MKRLTIFDLYKQMEEDVLLFRTGIEKLKTARVKALLLAFEVFHNVKLLQCAGTCELWSLYPQY